MGTLPAAGCTIETRKSDGRVAYRHATTVTRGRIIEVNASEQLMLITWLNLVAGGTVSGEQTLAILAAETLVLWRTGDVPWAAVTAIRDARKNRGTVTVTPGTRPG